MRKIAIIPALSMLILAACSNDDPKPLPDYPVKTFPPVADVPTMEIPRQNEGFQNEPGTNSATYRFTYQNGQEIVYEINTDVKGNAAVVKKIGGTSEKVVIPPSLSATMGGEPVTIPVVGLDLFVDPVTENVKQLTICGTVCNVINKENALKEASHDYLREQVNKCRFVEKIYLEPTYPGLASVDGVLYSKDLTSLVAVPKGVAGYFAVADGTVNVEDGAIYNCTKIDAVTFPASVKKIGHNAVVGTTGLMLVNMMPAEAPIAYSDSFGSYGYNGVLRIPAGSLGAYTFEPMDAPQEPAMPTPMILTKYGTNMIGSCWNMRPQWWNTKNSQPTRLLFSSGM